jgi:macrodomain Ter protein organizer (MatP/YcbG family)
MTGGKSKDDITADDIIWGLNTNKKVMAALATMDEKDRAAVFSWFKDTNIITQVNQKITDQMKKDFESGLWKTVTDKKELDEKLKAWNKIAGLSKDYTYTINSTDGKTKYTISVDKDKNILQSDAGTPITK